MEKTNLTEQDIEKCIKIFNEADIEDCGFINYMQLEECLSKLDISFVHENILYNLLSENNINFNKITFSDFLSIYNKHKPSNEDIIDIDTLDAFIALGGCTDGSGNIKADKLIEIIKKEFNMSIDIEALIREIDEDGNGNIDVSELKQLLQNSDYNKKFDDFQKIFVE